MKRIALISIILLNSLVGLSQKKDYELNEDLPVLKGFTTDSKLKDFKEIFPNYKFKRKVKTNISSYLFGEIEFNGNDYLCSGHFNENGGIVSIKFVSNIKNKPLKSYKKIIKILDSKQISFKKTSKNLGGIFLKQISYTKENMEYSVSLLELPEETEHKIISIGVKIEPIEDIIKKKNKLRERSENLKIKYGKNHAAFIMQGMISIGMSKEMVIESLGKPNKTNTSNNKNKISQQLVYYFAKKTMYVYLENGIVTSIKNMENKTSAEWMGKNVRH